ncbi:hypothetical protein DFJ73DRAFT_813730 [Zopfochytrium polystomum]|nr:hypothetical protein DFJ73DRAFT_813725 [Zopfochytrium polystomum]KAI9361614.1 hypothetical protein DFJ73DRAFT_813730 [Zopfochytrium polystomum]
MLWHINFCKNFSQSFVCLFLCQVFFSLEISAAPRNLPLDRLNVTGTGAPIDISSSAATRVTSTGTVPMRSAVAEYIKAALPKLNPGSAVRSF